MIPGATGDAGHFTRTSERLANEFTVITYDRRGNSRSPAGGDLEAAATMPAQADDAATLITACGFDKAVVFGTSGDATITLELLARRPDVVKGAIVHEPPLIALLLHQDPSPLEPIFELARTDPPAALEAFVRANSSRGAWDVIDPASRQRMLGNAENLFAREVGQFLSYKPDERVLRSPQLPVVLLRSRDGLEFVPYVQAWLEKLMGVEGGTLTGSHSPYFDIPEVFSEELRPILRGLSS